MSVLYSMNQGSTENKSHQPDCVVIKEPLKNHLLEAPIDCQFKHTLHIGVQGNTEHCSFGFGISAGKDT